MSDDNVYRRAVKYTRHAASTQFGDMSPEEFELLVASIKKDGQMDPIIVKGNEIVDGWHRYRACMEAKCTPFMWEYDPAVDGDLQIFVIKKNLLRRQLPALERARQAIELLGYEPKRGAGAHGGQTAASIAKAVNTSVATVKRALNEKEGKPKLAPKLSKDKQRIRELEEELAAARKEIDELKDEVKRLTPPPNPLKGMRMHK